MSSTIEEIGLEPIPATGLSIGSEEREAVSRVLSSGMLAQGPEVAAFEAEFGATVNGRPCVAVNSGTSALLLALIALGIGPGDEVIVPSFTFAATANAVVLAGARPVFADIEERYFGVAPEAVRAAIGPRTAAVVGVHLYGHPADVRSLARIAAEHGLAFVEDAAQAHLARSGGQPIGTFGSVAAFSFYPTKNMTSAEGGMAVCADEDVARRIRLLRNQGMERRYENEIAGYNARMTDVHASIGRVQLRRLPEWTRTRRRNAATLDESLAASLSSLEIGLPRVAPDAEPVWHQYTVRVADRDQVVRQLTAFGIPSGVYYPTPCHRLPAYNLDLDLPVTANAAAEVLSVPVHPALTAGHLERIVDGLVRAVLS